MASGDITRLFDVSLLSYFGWAGGGYPFGGTEDIIIASNTIWNDSSGYKKVKKLTINAGITLKIERSPFYIFCEELAGTGIIDISGPAGAESGVHPSWCTQGGAAISGTARAQAGCGGGMLFIVTDTISGAVSIKANGGNGYKNTNVATSSLYAGGQGALSPSVNLTPAISELWDGTSPVNTSGTGYRTYLHPVGFLLGKGAGGGSGGGSGGNSAGSGIGGGARHLDDGQQSRFALTPDRLLELAKYGCLGGGAGSATVSQLDGDGNGAGGGGGGSVVLWYRIKTATPALEANGGVGVPSSGGSSANGAAGVTHFITV